MAVIETDCDIAFSIIKSHDEMKNIDMKRHYISLVFQKAISDLIAETRLGYTGFLWWILEPVLYLGVFYVLFVVIFHRGGEGDVYFLLTGLVVWKWFAAPVLKCANCIAANNGLIRQLYIPKVFFPITVIINATIKFCVVFSLFIIFLLVTGVTPTLTWLFLPFLMLTQLLVIFSIGLFVASVVPFLPDLRLIIDNGIMLLFFLSGIFFDISSVSSDLKSYLYLNPMLGLIEAYRDVLLENHWPDLGVLTLIIGSALILMLVALWVLRKFDRMYAKLI